MQKSTKPILTPRFIYMDLPNQLYKSMGEIQGCGVGKTSFFFFSEVLGIRMRGFAGGSL